MTDRDPLGPLLDELRPWLADMAAQVVRSALAQMEAPTMLPGDVVDVDDAGVVSVIVDDPSGTGVPIPASPLVSVPVPGARVMVLFQPPSGVFVLPLP